MKTTLYAVFDKKGFVRATKTKPSRKANEIGMLIEVDIPDKAFDDGFLHASIAADEASFTLPEARADIVDIDQREGETA